MKSAHLVASALVTGAILAAAASTSACAWNSPSGISDSTFVAVMADLRRAAQAPRPIPVVRDTTHKDTAERDFGPRATIAPTQQAVKKDSAHKSIAHPNSARPDTTHRETTHRDTTRRDTTHKADTAAHVATPVFDSGAAQRTRDSIMRRYHVTEPRLEEKAREIAQNPSHAVDIVHAIDRKIYGPITRPGPNRPNMPHPFTPPGQRPPLPQPPRSAPGSPPPRPLPGTPGAQAPANAKRTFF